jgi:tetratricopeptide (TPR) repeat protein
MSEVLKKRLPVIIVAIVFVVLLGVFVWKSNIKEEQLNWTSTENLNLSNAEKDKYQETVVKLEQDEKDPEALINLARLRNWGGDPEGAIKIYLEALAMRPSDTLILNNLADVYYSIGDYKKAEEMYLTIIKNNPKWVSAYRELVNIYRFKLKDKSSQIPIILNKGLEANPEAGEDFYAMLGVYYQEAADKENAIKYFEKVLEANPQNTGAASALQELKGEGSQ